MRRRSVWFVGLLVSVVCAQAALAGSALAASGWAAYVVDLGTTSVAQLNTATNTTVGTAIPTGVGPLDVAITPDGKTAYVTNNGDGNTPGTTITPINTATNTPGTPITVGKRPRGIAITPDGKTVYVVNHDDNTITPINTATNAPGPAIPVGNTPEFVAITPDGRIAYVTNNADNTVTPIFTATNTPGVAIPVGKGPFQLAVTPDGRAVYVGNRTDNTVTPINTATNTAGAAIPVGTQPYGVAVTPDGKTVYVSNNLDNTVTPISTATNTAGMAIPVGTGPQAIAITPDGKTAYVANEVADSVSPINTATNTASTAIPFGLGAQPTAIAITPDQAPTAAFSVTAAPAGQVSTFNGSASSSPVGSVAGYQWDFGDGQSATTTTATTSHTYSQPGNYTARLTVTNSAGTSLAQVFTGLTVSNQGGPQAATTQALTVAKATPGSGSGRSQLSKLHVSPGSVSLAGRLVKGSCVKPSGKNRHSKRCRHSINLHVSYQLSSAANVTFTLKRQDGGRKVNGRCVKPSRNNRKHKRCTRLTGVSGKITKSGRAGSNTLNFNGKIGGRNLGRGTYQLTAKPSSGGSKQATFQITG